MVTTVGQHFSKETATMCYYGWRDSQVVSVLDFGLRDPGSGLAGRRWSRSNRRPVALCTLGLGLLNHGR